MQTTRNMMGSLALAGLAMALPAGQALAQDGGPDGGFTFGLLGFKGDTPYGFSDTAALPYLAYENDYVRVGIPSLDVKLPWVSSEQLSFGLTVDFLGGEGGYEADDAAILTGMAERKAGIWAGATVDWRSEYVDLSFKALTDASGESDGSTVKLEASRMFFLGERFTVTPKLGATWLDDKAVDYYYGVRAAEATTGRAAYKGSSTVNIEGGVTFGYMLAERHMLMLDLSVTRLGDGITDSPIVKEDTLTSVGLGYMFRF